MTKNLFHSLSIKRLTTMGKGFLIFGLFSLSSCGGGGDDLQKQLPALNGMSGTLTKEHAQAIAGMFELDGLQGLNVDDSLPMKLKSAGDLEDRVESYDQSCELLSQSGSLEDQDSDGVPESFKTEYQCSKCGLSEIPCRRTASAKDFNDNDWRAGHLSEFYQIYTDGTASPLFHIEEVNKESDSVYRIRKRTSICGNTRVECLADLKFTVEAGYATAEDCGFDGLDTFKSTIEESLGHKSTVTGLSGLVQFQASDESPVVLSVSSNKWQYACFGTSEGEIVFTDQDGNTLSMKRNQEDQEDYYSFLFNGQTIEPINH